MFCKFTNKIANIVPLWSAFSKKRNFVASPAGLKRLILTIGSYFVSSSPCFLIRFVRACISLKTC